MDPKVRERFRDDDDMDLIKFHKSMTGAIKKQKRMTGAGYDKLQERV